MLKVFKKSSYTYEDYLLWPEGERWEIINGEAYCMSPAYKIKHQKILSKLDYEFSRQLKRCTHFIAPVDVVFDRYNVVQPDLLVVGADEVLKICTLPVELNLGEIFEKRYPKRKDEKEKSGD